MVELPSIEALEAVHRFPGPYMFKVIGKSEAGFAARAVAAIREEMQAEVDPPFRTRETPGRRHISVTVEPTMQSAEQVQAVYRKLLGLTGLVALW